MSEDETNGVQLNGGFLIFQLQLQIYVYLCICLIIYGYGNACQNIS